MNRLSVLLIDQNVNRRRIIAAALRSRQSPTFSVTTAKPNSIAYLKSSPDFNLIMIHLEGANDVGQLIAQVKKAFPNVSIVVLGCGHQVRDLVAAVQAGASEFLCHDDPIEDRRKFSNELGNLLIRTLKLITHTNTGQNVRALHSITGSKAKGGVDIVAIGSSTGGPTALRTLLSALPGNFRVPIVVAQHMPAKMTVPLVESLRRLCDLPVALIKDETSLEGGGAWFAPGDHHAVVVRRRGEHVIRLNKQPRVNSVRPSFDVLLKSIVQLYQRRCVAAVLTGMGRDGVDGCRELKRVGGRVIVQDKESSVVWGMPGNVAQAGYADAILDPMKIAQKLTQIVNVSAFATGAGSHRTATLARGGKDHA